MKLTKYHAECIVYWERAAGRTPNLSGANLSGANLRGADLRGANLSGADLRGANLSGADLRGADLSEADLSEADLSEADLSGANLRGADLRWANLHGADLRWANLHGANLRGANLRGADLRWANLSGANMIEADLRGANLSGANLSGADLRGANLSGAKGLPSAPDLIGAHFKKSSRAILVYKAIGKTTFAPPSDWEIKPGAVLEEVCNWNRQDACGCGVNFGTLEFVTKNYPGQPVWLCKITPENIPGIVVPLNFDGKARCERLTLVRELSKEEIEIEAAK